MTAHSLPLSHFLQRPTDDGVTLRHEVFLTTRGNSRQHTCDRTFPYSSPYPETGADSKTWPSVRTRNFSLPKCQTLYYPPLWFTRLDTVRGYKVDIHTCKEPVGSLAFQSFAPHTWWEEICTEKWNYCIKHSRCKHQLVDRLTATEQKN